MNLYNVLFVDTESDPDTKKPLCFQYSFRNENGIIEDFCRENYFKIKEMWDSAEAIVFFNAPYDIGVLSIMFPENSYEWVEGKDKGSYWKFNIFGNKYNVRKLGFYRNLIKNLNRKKGIKSTPIIDLLKMWSILVDDGRNGNKLSLKALIERELGKKAIKYSKEAAKTEEYRLQDVIFLKELTYIFFNKTESIGTGVYGWQKLNDIKTPATFTKWAYDDAYDMKAISEYMNDYIKSKPRLALALEAGFNGGLTLSFYRGLLKNTGWVDISGAYVHAIEYLNTDSYLTYEAVTHDGENWNYKKDNCLLEVEVNALFKSINHSLKVFKLKKPCKATLWYNDIVALSKLFTDFDYHVFGGWEFIPTFPVKESLVKQWSTLKDAEKKKNGKTTLYDYFKFLGNTAYGIRAQRKPFPTQHTNMVIAGMITSTVHKVLATINYTIENSSIDGIYKVLYNDTDSAAFLHAHWITNADIDLLVDEINAAIFPYKVECEGFGKETEFLSLKRYVSEGGTGETKIKLHGKGRYNVYQTEIYDYVKFKRLPAKELVVTQISANTPIGMTQILNVAPYIEEYKHPFMFIKDIPSEKQSMETFFHKWYYHIDTKTTFKQTGDFLREYHVFDNVLLAINYFSNHTITEAEDINPYAGEYDKELFEDFYIDMD